MNIQDFKLRRTVALFLLFPLLFVFRTNRYLLGLFLVLASVIVTGCYAKYYTAKPIPLLTAEKVHELNVNGKTFYLHQPGKVTALVQPHVEGAWLVAISDSLANPLTKSPKNAEEGKAIMVSKKDLYVLASQVHLYTDSSFATATNGLRIPLSVIDRSFDYDLDKAAIRSNKTASTIGFVILGLVVTYVVLLLLACNCPQVSVEHDGKQEFLAGMYSGAIYSTLERQDMLALPYDGKSTAPYRLTIANPAAEEQFINSERILEVAHQPGTRVLAERNGTLHSLGTPVAPELAMAGDVDVLDKVMRKDDNVYAFDDSLPGIPASTLDLVFARPERSAMGKLVVHGGNSAWSGYVYKNFFTLFGDKYGAWLQRKEKDDPATMRKWELEQTLPLMVYLGTDTGWRFIDHLAMTGNTSSRDLVLGINLKDIKGPVRIRLVTAYRFWNLDQAGMDFTEDRILASTWVNNVSMKMPDEDTTIGSLSHNDGAYAHLVGNESIRLSFQPKISTDDQAYSYFLVGSGYYHAAVPAGKGAPDMARLLKFKAPHAIDAYSRELFNAAPGTNASIARLDLRKNH
jgi:hypothetical protein